VRQHCLLPTYLPAREEVARGQVGKDAEWWVERLMQMYKGLVGKRVSRCPEKTFAKLLLLVQRLDQLRLEDPSVKEFDEWIPEYRAAPLEGPTVDDGDEASGTVLLGKGVPVGRKSKAVVLQLLKAYLRDVPVAGWQEQDLVEAAAAKGIVRFTRAFKNGDEIIASSQYGRAYKRQNFWVTARFAKQGQQQGAAAEYVQHVLKVKYYLLVRHPSGDAAQVLKLAVCSKYKAEAQEGRMLVAKSVAKDDLLLSVNSIDVKLVAALPNGMAAGSKMYFMYYSNVSKVR
jgi:hypothetical protein